MARKPIQNLQGTNQISSPSASPVDAFTGAPRLPSKTPASQLADALQVFSTNVNRAAAQNQSKIEDDQAKLSLELAEIKADQGDKIVTQTQLQEEFAQASVAGLAAITKDSAHTKAYNQTKAVFDKILRDDDLVLDVNTQQNLLSNHYVNLTKGLNDNPFALAGINSGYENAIAQTKPQLEARKDTLLRIAAGDVISNSILEIFSAINWDSAEAGKKAYELIQNDDNDYDIEYPLNNAARVKKWKEGIINQAKVSRDARYLEVLKEGWLQDVDNSTYKVALKEVQNLQATDFFNQLDRDEKIRKQSVRNEKDKIQQSFVGGEEYDTQNLNEQPFEVIEYYNKLSKDSQINTALSNTARTNFDLNMRAAYRSNNFSFVDKLPGQTPSLEEIKDIIDSLSMKPEDQNKLKAQAEIYAQGYEVILDPKVTTYFNAPTRAGSKVQRLMKKAENSEDFKFEPGFDPVGDVEETFFTSLQDSLDEYYGQFETSDKVIPLKPEMLTGFLKQANEEAMGAFEEAKQEMEGTSSLTPQTNQDRYREDEQLDRTNAVITLTNNQRAKIQDALADLDELNENNVMKAIGKVLGVSNDSDYMYEGLLDTANTTEEKAMEKLVNEYTDN